jgi:hypothetical protein
MTDDLGALRRRREHIIEKLERDIALMEAECDVFEADDLNQEKIVLVRQCINGMKEALTLLRVVHKQRLPLVSQRRPQ